jgi:hypothetical protein
MCFWLTHKMNKMKRIQVYSVLALLLTLALNSCQVIGDIFKTGVGVGVFMVIAVLGLIIFVVAKLFGGGK